MPIRDGRRKSRIIMDIRTSYLIYEKKLGDSETKCAILTVLEWITKAPSHINCLLNVAMATPPQSWNVVVGRCAMWV